MMKRNNKFRSIIFILILGNMVIGCKKDPVTQSQGLFIKSVGADSSVVAVSSLVLHDAGYLVIGRDKKHESPGYAFKISKDGNIIYKRRLSGLITNLQGVIDMPGDGFATFGYNNPYQKILVLCLYDYEAGFTGSKQINLPDFAGNYPIFRVLHLSNGNYAFASGNGVGLSKGDLVFTDASFNNLNAVSFTAPTNIGFYGFAINALCELPGNTIAIGGSTHFYGPTALTSYSNLFIQRIDFAGNKLSFSMTGDSVHSETPNGLFNVDGNIFAITGRSTGWNSGNGCFVDYEFSRFNSTISGTINLNLLDTAGTLIKRNEIRNYPFNGMIQSAKPTIDGGYILCGTVNQANSLTAVSETQIYLIKLDKNRNPQWNRIINTIYPSYGVNAIQTKDGGYLITGHENTFNNKFNALVIKTDENGDL